MNHSKNVYPICYLQKEAMVLSNTAHTLLSRKRKNKLSDGNIKIVYFLCLTPGKSYETELLVVSPLQPLECSCKLLNSKNNDTQRTDSLQWPKKSYINIYM